MSELNLIVRKHGELYFWLNLWTEILVMKGNAHDKVSMNLVQARDKCYRYFILSFEFEKNKNKKRVKSYVSYTLVPNYYTYNENLTGIYGI